MYQGKEVNNDTTILNFSKVPEREGEGMEGGRKGGKGREGNGVEGRGRGSREVSDHEEGERE